MTDQRTILVIGASRGIGAAVVAEALKAGHHVRAMARHTDKIPDHPHCEPVTGDATKADDLVAAVEETARTWGDQPFWRPLRYDRPPTFDGRTLQSIPMPSDSPSKSFSSSFWGTLHPGVGREGRY